MNGAFVLAVLNLLPMVLQQVAGAAEVMSWGKERIEDMVAKQRDPTPEEWDELNGRIQALKSALHTDPTAPMTAAKVANPEPPRAQGPQG